MRFPFNFYLCALLGAGLTTALTMRFWRRWCERTGMMDDPGHRKIHHQPIALAGGLAVMSGLIVPLVAAAVVTLSRGGLFAYGFSHRGAELTGILFGAIGMLTLGLLDDKIELRPAVKFGGQLLIALIVAASGVRITLFVHSVPFSYFVTVLWILTVVNAFNFMDNMNGLCGGLGAIGAWYFGWISATYGEYLVAAIAFLVTGALLGFLPHNFPKASVFLGDAGSHLIGYLLAVLAILPHFYTRNHPHVLAVFIPLIILAVPLGDLLSVVIIRWKLGKPFYIGDNNHLSHRLVRRGLSQTRAVLIIWLLATVAGALVLF